MVQQIRHKKDTILQTVFDSDYILRLSAFAEDRTQYVFEVCSQSPHDRCCTAFLSATTVKNYQHESYYQNLLNTFSSTVKHHPELISAAAAGTTAAVYQIIPPPPTPKNAGFNDSLLEQFFLSLPFHCPIAFYAHTQLHSTPTLVKV